MMLEQANRQIARAAAREARRRELETFAGVDVTQSANDNKAVVVLARPSTILPPAGQDELVEEVALEAPSPGLETLVEAMKPAKAPKDGFTCGIILPHAAHAILKKRAEVNKTSLKIEVLRAVFRDL